MLSKQNDLQEIRISTTSITKQFPEHFPPLFGQTDSPAPNTPHWLLCWAACVTQTNRATSFKNI